MLPNASSQVVLLMVVHPGLRGSRASFSWTFSMLGRFLQTVMKTASFPFCWDLRRVAISKRCCCRAWAPRFWMEVAVSEMSVGCLMLFTPMTVAGHVLDAVHRTGITVLRGIWEGYRAWSFSRGGWEKSSPEGQSVWQQEWSCQFGIRMGATIYTIIWLASLQQWGRMDFRYCFYQK